MFQPHGRIVSGGAAGNPLNSAVAGRATFLVAGFSTLAWGTSDVPAQLWRPTVTFVAKLQFGGYGMKRFSARYGGSCAGPGAVFGVLSALQTKPAR
jgi:hypothetical protein